MPALDVAGELVPAGRKARFELCRALFDAADLSGERCRALGERRVIGLSFGNRAAASFDTLTRGKQPALRGGKALVSGPLLRFEPLNGRACFGLACFDRLALVVRPPSLERDLLLLPRDAFRLLVGGRKPQLELDDRFFLPMALFGDQRDARFGRGNRERRRLHLDTGAGELGSLGIHPAAQIANLALRREDAARLRAGAARDEMRPTKQLALRGHDGQRRRAGGGQRGVKALGDPGFPERRPSGVRVLPARTDNGGKRDRSFRLG